MEDTKIQQTEEFKYLGAMFTEDGRMDKEIDTRCMKAYQVLGQLSPLLQHQNIPITTKKNLIQSIFIPTLCYQCQTWALTKRQESKITAIEMRCLRKAIGVTKRDRIRNEIIRERIGMEPVLKYVQRQQIKWFGHVMRMPTNTLPQRTYNNRSSGRRRRGKPRKRWCDNIKSILQQQGILMTEATHLTYDRKLHLPRHQHSGIRGS